MDDGRRYEYSFEDSNLIDVDIHAAGLSASVVPIFFWERNVGISFQATAFCLARFKSGESVFATAKHVFTDLIDRSAVVPGISTVVPGISTVVPGIAMPRSPAEPSSLIGVRIRQASLAEDYSDVALFVVNPKRDEPAIRTEPSLFKVTFGPPHVGQACMALGLPQQRGVIDYRLVASRGGIEEVHQQRRDRVLMPYPSFRVSAEYKFGMSGGPIIDLSGRVIGVVSSGAEMDEPESIYAYGAAIGSILELRLNLYDDSDNLQDFSVPQLADGGFIGDRSDSVITLDRNAGGVTLTWAPPIDSQEGSAPAPS